MRQQAKRKLQLTIGFVIFCIAVVASYFSVVESSGKKHDVFLVLDVSGSMASAVENGGQLKLDAAKEASIRFLQVSDLESNPNIRVGLITFSTEVSVEANLTSDVRSLLGDVQRLSPLAATSVGDAIQKGVEILVEEGKVSADHELVLMTDGNSNADHVVSDDPQSAPLLAANHANQSNIIVHVVAFGSDADVSMCKAIATITGGRYFFAATGDELVSAFSGIASTFVSPTIHYVSRIMILVAVPLMLFLPAIEKGVSIIYRTFLTTIQDRPKARCPKCDHIVKQGSKVCEHCGNLLLAPERPCPRCNHSNRVGAKFCSKCGEKL